MWGGPIRIGQEAATYFLGIVLPRAGSYRVSPLGKGTERYGRYPRVADTTPRVVSGADATDVNSDRSAATEQLNELAEKQRTISPFLSFAQCFSRVMADPANSDLAARALARSGQSMSGGNRQ